MMTGTTLAIDRINKANAGMSLAKRSTRSPFAIGVKMRVVGAKARIKGEITSRHPKERGKDVLR